MTRRVRRTCHVRPESFLCIVCFWAVISASRILRVNTQLYVFLFFAAAHDDAVEVANYRTVPGCHISQKRSSSNPGISAKRPPIDPTIADSMACIGSIFCAARGSINFFFTDLPQNRFRQRRLHDRSICRRYARGSILRQFLLLLKLVRCDRSRFRVAGQ
jgi:hypothetical protein